MRDVILIRKILNYIDNGFLQYYHNSDVDLKDNFQREF